MAGTLSLIYAVLILGVIGFQVALILGAPWGHLTQGGRTRGALPRSGRLAAAASILVLVGIALAILSAAGHGPDWPRWTGWVALAVSTLSMIANWATPSAPERRLWAPVTTVLFLLALAVMVTT